MWVLECIDEGPPPPPSTSRETQEATAWIIVQVELVVARPLVHPYNPPLSTQGDGSQSKCSGHAERDTSQLAIAPYTGGGDSTLAASPFGKGRAFSDDGEGDGAISEPPTKKKKKMQHSHFEQEVMEKLAVLRGPNWALHSCDKSADGLLTRLTNNRDKLLESGDPQSAAPMSSLILHLTAMTEFGAVYKKHYGKTKKESALVLLVEPVRKLSEVEGSRSALWHFSLRRLAALVDFQDQIAEGRFGPALASLQMDKLQELFYEEDSSPQQIMTRSIEFLTERVERVVTACLARLLANKKKFPELLQQFSASVSDLAQYIPKVPVGFACAEYDDALRNRAERMAEQVQALPVLACAGLCALGTPGIVAPWPAAIKAAKDALLATPKTKIGHAFDEYAGARLLLTRVEGLSRPSALDDHARKVILKATEALGDIAIPNDPSAVDMDNLMLNLTSCTNAVVSLAEVVPKLSMVGYEDVAADIKRGMGQVADVLGTFWPAVWRRLAVDLVSRLDGIVQACGVQGFSVRSLTANQIDLFKQLSKATKFLLTTLGPWSLGCTRCWEVSLHFLDKILKPIAKETFFDFEAPMMALKKVGAAVASQTSMLRELLEGLQSISEVMTSPDTSRPMKDLGGTPLAILHQPWSSTPLLGLLYAHPWHGSPLNLCMCCLWAGRARRRNLRIWYPD